MATVTLKGAGLNNYLPAFQEYIPGCLWLSLLEAELLWSSTRERSVCPMALAVAVLLLAGLGSLARQQSFASGASPYSSSPHTSWCLLGHEKVRVRPTWKKGSCYNLTQEMALALVHTKAGKSHRTGVQGGHLSVRLSIGFLPPWVLKGDG